MYELVYLEWIDSASNDTWQSLTAYKPGCTFCKSVGWLVHETDQVMTLASNVANYQAGGDPDLGCGWIVIPKVAIIRQLSLLMPADMEY